MAIKTSRLTAQSATFDELKVRALTSTAQATTTYNIGTRASAAGISVVDSDLNLVAWNSRYLELFNYPPRSGSRRRARRRSHPA